MSAPPAVRAVLFDLHSTLLDQGDSTAWATAAADLLGHLDPVLDDPRLLAALDTIWDDAKDADPHSLRDVDPAQHRAVYDAMVASWPFAVAAPVADALYATKFAAWHAYADAAAVLEALRELGVATVALSNIAHDIRPVLDREGLLARLDAVVLSFEVGAVKPAAAVFDAALAAVGVARAEALMVGDSWRADGGAAALGIRSLVLPRTSGPVHGLGVVADLVRGTLGR